MGLGLRISLFKDRECLVFAQLTIVNLIIMRCGVARKHAINFPCEEIALALGLALPRFAWDPCPLGLRDGFLSNTITH